MDIDALHRKIEAATRAACAEMVHLHQDEGIYAFALYSDAGAMTVCPSTNTRAHLDSQDKADAYYKFTPAEWKYEMQGADAAFNAISTLAREIVFALKDRASEGGVDDEMHREAFTTFRAALFEACIAVLEKLKREGYFRQTLGEEVFLAFDISDHDWEPAQLAAIITRLNDPPYRDEYLAWMQS